MEKVDIDIAKNIFYTLFDRRVSAKGAHNADRKNKKSENLSISAFSTLRGSVIERLFR